MSEEFDKLKSIGAQKIHENTHISRAHITALLNDGFEDMTKIQFLGFISILEREYNVNLDDLKDRALAYFLEQEKEIQEENKVFLTPKKKNNLTPIYLTLLIIVFSTFIYVSIDSSKTDEQDIIEVDNTIIESAKNTISTNIDEVNTTVTNMQELETSIKDPQADNEIVSFKIIPKVKVWLGYVNLKTHRKYQKTFQDEFDLDPSKDWLLAFGHGHLNIEINGIVKKYKIRKNVRFSYIDGELKEINLKEFKELNKGARW